MPTTNPLFRTNHLDVVVLTTVKIAPVPRESRKLYVMYSCHASQARLVSKRPRPVKVPMKKPTLLGPYLSMAHPPSTDMAQQINIYTEKMLDVAALLTPKSASKEVRNTPKEYRDPNPIMLMRRPAAVTTHP